MGRHKLGFFCLGIGKVVGVCEHNNEFYSSIKCSEFDYLRSF